MKRTLAETIVAMCLGLLALSSSAEDAVPQIMMDHVPLYDAIRNLARGAEINYILDPRVPPDDTFPVVTVTWKNITVKDAFLKVLNEHNLVMVENPATSVARIVPKGVLVQPVPKTWLGSDTNAALPKVEMDYVPFDEAVKSLTDQLHLKVSTDNEFPRDIRGRPIKISVRWENLTAKQALVALLDNYNLLLVVDATGSTARIIPNDKSAQRSPP